MYRDSNTRTFLKTITWRITATATTTILVFLFTGAIDTAIQVGLLELVAKMLFYYLHERGWDKIKWGKEEVPAFVLWITGIPCSGKTTLATMIKEELVKDKLRVQHLDSHDVRPLFPETGFTKEEVDNHIKRVGHLASMLEKNGIITIASFVSPYRNSRLFVRKMCRNYVEVHLNTTADIARKYDRNGFYEKVDAGVYKNVPGCDVEYETCENTEYTIDMTRNNLEEAKSEIMKLLKSKYLKK